MWKTSSGKNITCIFSLLKAQDLILIWIKECHLNSSKFHLDIVGANIFGSTFTQHGSKDFKQQLSGNISCCIFSELDFEENESSNSKQVKQNCWSALNNLFKDNLDKLIFAHTHIKLTQS